MTTRHNLERALHAAENGALVLTSNTRAARNLKREFADRKRAAGKDVWESPEILPWSAWLKRLWHDQIYRSPGRFTALLESPQERIVWERVIATEREGLDAVSLARECQRAWRLLHAFQLPRTRSAFLRKKDTATFFRWAESYSAQCLKNGWLDEARLPDAVSDTATIVCKDRKVVLWGFDRFTPQQQMLVNALSGAGVICEGITSDAEPGRANRVLLDDTHAELRAAAHWARALLERSPDAKIGLVIPDLEGIRGTVERILLEVLHPDALTIEGTDRRRAFDISLGVPISKVPLIATGFLLLRIASGPIPLETASQLVRSFFVGVASELGARGLLDTQIRAAGLTEVSLSDLHAFATDRADLIRFAASVRAFRDAVMKLPKKQIASRWSRELLGLLRTAGWPGSRQETSAEHQGCQAFADLLAHFARFDLVLEAIDFAAMLRRLQALAEETLFQPENLGAPIQVMGMLEAAGSHFDRVWVVGMHADAWPPVPNPSPFLPLELQRSAGVTGASSEERLDYARVVTSRIQCSAAEIIFSSPKRDGDQELAVSPLIREFDELGQTLQRASETSSSVLFSARQSEALADETGPSLSAPRTKGGTRIFQLQAACPFRAFAELRLGAKELEMPAPGMDRRLRGKLLHDALEEVWKELHSSNVLRSTSQVELEELVARNVDHVIMQSDVAELTGWEREVAQLERKRLTRLTLDLLQLEREQRAPFAIHQLEEKEDIEFGGVATDVKVDRVDVLEDGRYVLLDYKSGEPKISSWQSDRPDEPQLPIYATQLKEKLAAVAFVQLARGRICFKGYAQDDGLLPDTPAFATLSDRKRPEPSWEELLQRWEETLHRLGRNYREGRAAVDPKKPATCNYCHLGMLCRIDEAPPAPEGDEDDE